MSGSTIIYHVEGRVRSYTGGKKPVEDLLYLGTDILKVFDYRYKVQETKEYEYITVKVYIDSVIVDVREYHDMRDAMGAVGEFRSTELPSEKFNTLFREAQEAKSRLERYTAVYDKYVVMHSKLTPKEQELWGKI